MLAVAPIARRLVRGSFALVVALGMWTADISTAEAAPVEFRWDAPAGCPSEADVREEVERLLGASLEAEGPRRLTVIARVRKEEDGQWDLRLWTVGEQTRHRSIRDESCERVAQAGALIAAMVIDPEAEDRADAQTQEAASSAEELDASEPPPVEPDEAPPVEPEPAPEPPVVPVEPRVGPPHPWSLGVAAGGSFGDLPSFGASLRLTASWRRRSFRLDTVLHYGFPRSVTFDGSDEGGELQLANAGVRGCQVWSWVDDHWALPLCGGLEAGAMFGRGRGLDEEQIDATVWAAAVAGPAALWRPAQRRLGLWLGVEGFVPFVRPSFSVTGRGTLYRPPVAGFRALLGVHGRFGE